jgi:hypothetical protein
MDAISAAQGGYAAAQALLAQTGTAIAEGYVTPEVVTARDAALTQADIQVEVLEEALNAQRLILDLLA